MQKARVSGLYYALTYVTILISKTKTFERMINMSLFNKLFVYSKPSSDNFCAYTVYRKRRFGSNYPNLTKEEKKKYKHLLTGMRKRSRKILRNVEHPGFINIIINR